jgi:hypothetical protein
VVFRFISNGFTRVNTRKMGQKEMILHPLSFFLYPQRVRQEGTNYASGHAGQAVKQ